jgi:hypothetical protein
MGLLDPKMDKARTFELLKKRDAIKAVLSFQGGHDEGSVESIILTLNSGEEVELEPWYCGGYMYEKGKLVPMTTPVDEDAELADLLEGPINAEFGSWGSVGSTYGSLTWDVFTGTAKLSYTQDVARDFETEVF